jgi:hypothetical protein
VKRRECSRPTTTPAATKFGSLEEKVQMKKRKEKKKKVLELITICCSRCA